MRSTKKFLLLTIIFSLFVHPSPGTFPDSTQKKIISSNTADSLSKLLKPEFQKNQESSLERDIEFAKEHIELANRIIDWSAAMFTALAILLVIAGAIGLKEFSDIRKTKRMMTENLNSIKVELAEIQHYKSTLVQETRQFIEIHYYLNEAIQAYQSGDYLKTRDLLDNVLQIEPNHVEALLYIGKSFSMEYKENEADVVFEKVLLVDPNNSEAYYGLAMNSLELEPSKSIQYFNKAIDLNPKHYKAYGFLGILQREAGDLDSAFRLLKKSYAIKPTSTNTFFLGLLFYADKDHENARRYFDEAKFYAGQKLEKISQWHWEYYIIGVIEGLYGKVNTAKKYIKMSLQYNKSIRIRNRMKSHLLFVAKKHGNTKKLDSMISFFENN